MPCPPDPRERSSRLICDVDSEVKALHKQASTMRDTLAMLARHGAEYLDPEREDLIEPPTLPVPEEPTYNDVRRAESKGRSAKKRYEMLCCRLGTQIARFAKGPRLAALSAHERKQVTECLDVHRTHRHADRDTVVRVARQQGHYDRAVMAKWLPDERLMTVRSSLHLIYLI